MVPFPLGTGICLLASPASLASLLPPLLPPLLPLLPLGPLAGADPLAAG